MAKIGQIKYQISKIKNQILKIKDQRSKIKEKATTCPIFDFGFFIFELAIGQKYDNGLSLLPRKISQFGDY